MTSPFEESRKKNAAEAARAGIKTGMVGKVVDVAPVKKPNFTETLKAELKKLEGDALESSLAIIAMEGSAIRSGSNRIMVNVNRLDESPTNPRKIFVSIDELAVSVKTLGILQPILVRRSPTAPTRFQIISGARRFRAALEAELREVPCDLFENVSELDVLAIQAAENLQREDLTPIEEGEAYAALLEKGLTSETIGQSIGVSAATVRGRVKLLSLSAEAQKLIATERMTATVGTVLARSCPTHGLQGSFLRKYDVASKDYDTRELIGILQREFTHTLAQAPFDLKDVALHGGSCKACPKNARNGEKGLFDDLEAARDICTDVDCYRKKVKEAVHEKAQEAKAEGLEVLRGAEAKDALANHDLVPLTSMNYDAHGKPTWESHIDRLPENKRPDVVAVVDEKTGDVVKLVSKRAVTKAVAETSPAKWAKNSLEEDEARKKAKAAAKSEAQHSAHASAIARDVALAISSGADVSAHKLMRMVAQTFLEGAYLEAHELEALNVETIEDLEKKIDRMQGPEVLKLLVAIAVWRSDVAENYVSGEPKELKALAKAFSVDLTFYEDARKNAAEAEALFAKKGK